MAALTSEQISFLEECEQEFSDRYTVADPAFEKIFEAGVPAPPIVFPWYGRSRHNNRGEYNRNHEDRRSDNKRNYDDRRFENRRNYDDRSDRGDYNRNRGFRGDGQY